MGKYCGKILRAIGVWRRLVARYLGVVEAVGSSPVTPTSRKVRKWRRYAVCGLSFLLWSLSSLYVRTLSGHFRAPPGRYFQKTSGRVFPLPAFLF